MTDQLTTDVEVALTASRALLGVVARSMVDVLEEVTLPQFRVLVVLSGRGRMRVGTLATTMGAVASTFSRTVDRMVAAGWLIRTANPDNRREVLVDLSPDGRRLVASVTDRRRRELRRVLSDLPPEQRATITAGLRAFTDATGEPPAEELLLLGL